MSSGRNIGTSPRYFHPPEEAIGAIKNMQTKFVGAAKGCMITRLDIDRYGLRTYGESHGTEYRDTWVPTTGGFITPNLTYVPYYGGSYQTQAVAVNDDESYDVPFNKIKTLSLLYGLNLQCQNKWLVIIRLTGGSFWNQFRFTDAQTAAEFITAIETLGVAAGSRIEISRIGSVWENVSKETANKLKIDPISGVVITSVSFYSPAAKAGLQTGDIITECNGKKALNTDYLLGVFNALTPANNTVQLKVLRKGDLLDKEVALYILPGPTNNILSAKQPSSTNTGGPAKKIILGITCRELTALERKTLGLSSTGGIVVTGLHKDSGAEKSGIQIDDVILECNGKAVKNPDDLNELLNKDGPNELKVLRDGKVNTYRVK